MTDTEGSNAEPRIAASCSEHDVHKLAIALADGALVECVLIPMPARADADARRTLCVSTQVGCRMGCRFCATARMGWRRNLEASEIVAQVELVAARFGRPDNIVFMGMGEPLDNFDAWHEAVERLRDSRRRGAQAPQAYSTLQMTVSTCGHVEGMRKLAGRPFRKMSFALSLNAARDELRSELMPVNRRWPLAELREALLALPLRHGVFLAEYVCFAGVNDGPDDAVALAEYLRGLRGCVNLIAYNPPGQQSGAEDPLLRRPSDAAVEAFRERLAAQGVYARVRESKGRRIDAACGQLVGALGTGAEHGIS